jgi:hypothetical protein
MLVSVRLFFAKVPYVARPGYGRHNSLSLTSLSLLYRFANVLRIRTLFLLLKTF